MPRAHHVGGLRFKAPKTDKARAITLPAFAVEELRRLKREQAERLLGLGVRLNGDTLLCARADGEPHQPRSLTHEFTYLVGRIKDLPRARFHDLRHSHATQLLTAGVHPKIAQERLGHSTISTTPRSLLPRNWHNAGRRGGASRRRVPGCYNGSGEVRTNCMTQANVRPFGMTSCREMLGKLEREIERLASSSKRDDIVDYALNAAWTAWHLPECVWPDTAHSVGLRERISEEIGEPVPARDPYTLRRHAVKHCPDLRLCELIGNSAKHLECRTLGADSQFGTAVTPAEVTLVNEHGQPTAVVNDNAEPITTWTDNAWELWIRTEAGERRRAAEVFNAVLYWWTQFVYGNKVDELQEPLPEGGDIEAET